MTLLPGVADDFSSISYNHLMPKSNWKQLLDASQVGIQLVISTFIGLAIGWFIDEHLHTSPWFTIIFFFLGIAAGFIELFRFMKRKGGGNGQGGNRDQ